MRSLLGSVMVFAVPLLLCAAEPPAEPGASLEKLTGVLDRLTTALEKELAFRADDSEAQRVELAVGILGMRYRKIDRLEAEIQSIGREEEEFARQADFMKVHAEQLDSQARDESGQLSAAAKVEIEQLELRIKMEGERVARLRERALILQNQVTEEHRRLVSVESILDAWIEKQ